MGKYEIMWSAYGTAEVEADSLDEAMEIASEAIHEFSDTELDRAQVDGSEVREQ